MLSSSYHIPRSPNFFASEFAPKRKITLIADWNNPTAVVSENCNPFIP
jgi:hypothetical protein